MTFLLREPWRTRLLFASVAGNLFSAALIGAHLLRPRASHGMDGVVERMVRDLPAADAERFRAILAREQAWQAKAWHRVNEARAALSRSIGQTPYDEAAVRAGDAVVIAPGVPHKLFNTGPEPLVLMCSCSPAYSHEDTVLLEDA